MYRVLSQRVSFVFFMVGTAAMLSGCTPSSGPEQPNTLGFLDPAFDVSSVQCAEIDAARQRVDEAYTRVTKEIGDTYVEAIKAFQAEQRDCERGIRDKGPCDDQNAALQQAYEKAINNISDDGLYNDYKAAKKNRDECFANREQKYEDRANDNKRKEQDCRDTFQMKHDEAERIYYNQKNAAKAQRDAALANLDELEKKCKTPVSGGQTNGGGVTDGQTNGGGGETGTPTGTPPSTETADPGEEITPPDTSRDPQAEACVAAATVVDGGRPTTTEPIPGANSQVRTGKAAPLGAADVLKELLQAIAEDVTGSPIPTSAISDQVFAGIVCVKIRSRLAELEIEQSDAQLGGDRKTEIRLRKKIQDYNHAMQVRCGIAEGRPPLNLKDDMQKIQDADYGEQPTGNTCEAASECGESACCSETELATRTCTSGKCLATKKTCPTGYVCGGSPAACLKAVKALEYQGMYIPLDQVHSFKGPECDEAEHRHANAKTAKATDGTKITDPGDCGYGKVSEVKVVTVFVE